MLDFAEWNDKENSGYMWPSSVQPAPCPTPPSPLRKTSGANNNRRKSHYPWTKNGGQVTLVRFLLVEAAQVTVRSLPEWRSQYFRLMMRRGRKTAKVAMARQSEVDHSEWSMAVLAIPPS